MLAVEERQPKATESERDLLPNANSAAVESVAAKSSNSNVKMSSESGSSVDHVFTETPLQEISSSQMEPAASTPISAPVTPQNNRDAPRPDSARVGGRNVRDARNRTSVAFGYTGVRRRLIELWHQSLARSEKTRSWTAFSKLNSVLKKKAAYTAGTND
jgi:hypothetical protein